jgi:hypothetical protein
MGRTRWQERDVSLEPYRPRLLDLARQARRSPVPCLNRAERDTPVRAAVARRPLAMLAGRTLSRARASLRDQLAVDSSLAAVKLGLGASTAGTCIRTVFRFVTDRRAAPIAETKLTSRTELTANRLPAVVGPEPTAAGTGGRQLSMHHTVRGGLLP